MINVAAIVSVRNLPVMAEYGWSMLALFAISIVVFLIPIAMVAAELGTGWPRDGGVFAWVKEAFGGRTGFLAVWCDYSENLAWFPTVLSFMAATLAYAINPDLASNSTYLVIVMLVFFWLTTMLNLRGVSRRRALLGSLGTIAGSIFPAILVVGARNRLPGPRRQVADPVLSGQALSPNLQLANLAFLGGIILLFAGMEMAGFHARDTRNPGRDIPRSIALAVGHHRGVLGARIAVPGDRAAAEGDRPRLGHHAAFPERARHFPCRVAGRSAGDPHRRRRYRPPVAVDPRARPRAWPRLRARVMPRQPRPGECRRGARSLSLIFQGIGGTIFSLLFLLVPNVSTSYWMLSAVTAQIVIIMYGLMFAAVIRLRYTQPDTPRPYRIPGGKIGVWLVCGVGLLGLRGGVSSSASCRPASSRPATTVVYVLLLAPRRRRARPRRRSSSSSSAGGHGGSCRWFDRRPARAPRRADARSGLRSRTFSTRPTAARLANMAEPP